MKVTNGVPAIKLDPASQNRKATEIAQEGRNLKEKVTMSAEAKEALKIDQEQIRSNLQSLSDVREDKVAAIKAAMDNGAYNPPADKVAEKMINLSLFESLYRKS